MEPLFTLKSLGIGVVGVSAGQKLYGVMPGDKVRVKAIIGYRGPAWSDYFYAAIGEWRGITWPTDIGFFDEVWNAKIAANFDASADWQNYELTVDVPITQVGHFPWTPGWFDLYVKLDAAEGQAGYPRLDNVIEVILAPEFQNFAITAYEKAAG